MVLSAEVEELPPASTKPELSTLSAVSTELKACLRQYRVSLQHILQLVDDIVRIRQGNGAVRNKLGTSIFGLAKDLAHCLARAANDNNLWPTYVAAIIRSRAEKCRDKAKNHVLLEDVANRITETDWKLPKRAHPGGW